MKIGVLGGTFDPVHNGHILMAHSCMRDFSLDRVMFLPNGNPPHKKDNNVTEKSHRFSMLSLAIENEDGFFLSDYEYTKEGYCYSVETLREFRKASDDDYFLIIGADSFYQLECWYKFEDLVRENFLIVVDRQYLGHENIENDINEFNHKYSANVNLCKMPVVDISSTDIRKMISSGDDVCKYIPDKVYEYIRQNKLYTDKED